MDITSQMDLLEKNYLAGLISEKEYDEAIDDLIRLQNQGDN